MTKTVLQVIPRMGAGGAEQACVDITAGLVARGDTALVASNGGARVKDIQERGGEPVDGPYNSKNPLTLSSNARELARIIRTRHVRVVHARSRAPAWSAFMACRRTQCPFVTTFHAAYAFSNPLKKFYNGVMARADRVIAISDFIATHIRESYGVGDDRLRVIPRGLDLVRFSPSSVTEDRREALRRAWNLKDDRQTILLPARLSPIKGQALFIRAMASVSPDTQAIIVGDDQGRVGYRRELDDAIAALNLGGRIKIVPHCADMPAAYAVSDLVIVPSQVPEGFGRVPVEAMAMGVPVIASDLGAMRETVQHGITGWRVTPDDGAGWSDAMKVALRQPEDMKAAMAVAARRTVEARYDLRQMVAATLAVYDEFDRVKT